eukprot:m.1800 g.1800  ORF g.1800 m.1800 type:complete len:487 (+) comp7861_c0_seq1:201-1661(+)
MWTVLAAGIVVAAILALSTAILLTLALYHKRRRFHTIPGPPLGSFFEGHIPQLRKLSRESKPLHSWALELYYDYGPVFILWLGHREKIYVSDPDSIKDFLTDTSCLKASSVYSCSHSIYGARFVGSGLASNVDHENWRFRRRAIAPAFTRTVIKHWMLDYNRETDNFLRKLSELSKMAREFPKFTLNAIIRVTFGIDPNSIDSLSLLDSLKGSCNGLHFSCVHPFAHFLSWKYPEVDRIRSACAHVRRTAEEIVERRLSHPGSHDDALSRIIQMRKDNPELTRDDELDEVVTLLLAGFDPLSVALSCAVASIERNEKIKEKLIAEIDSVLGKKEAVAFEDLPELKYTESVFHEALRFCPPAYATVRTLPNERRYCGVSIPAGSDVTASFYILHGLDKFWDNPAVFNPDRFKDGHRDIEPYTYLPFSGGHRICLGETMATMQAKIVLARLYQTFQVTLVDKSEPLEFYQDMLMRPKMDVLCRLKRRK